MDRFVRSMDWGTDSLFPAASVLLESLVLLYIMGCIVPTLLEYLTAQVMLFIFGEVWWDYNEKPFNYKGILCLESTIAWGFYTVGLFLFLQNAVERFVDSYSFEIGCVVSTFSIMLYMVDFSYSFYQAKRVTFQREWKHFDAD